jgi:hypothetical protein
VPLDKRERRGYNKVASDNLSDLRWRPGGEFASFLVLE